jgi:hypothetical protein
MNSSWLDKLAPEHAPAPPGWWPPAPGWWALAVLALGIAFGVWAWWRSPRRRLRDASLAELRALRAADLTVGETAQAIQNLLRRYALALFGQDTVARINGSAWLEFLAQRGAPPFGGAIGRSLLAASYGGGAEGADRAGWFDAAETFLRRARVTSRRSATPRAARARGRTA